MQALTEFRPKGIRYLLTDIDDTLTTHGRLSIESLRLMEQLKEKGFTIIPVTGRPAGFCQGLLSMWPIEAIIAENGCVAFVNNQLSGVDTLYWRSLREIKEEQSNLRDIAKQILINNPWVKETQDQFMRIGDHCFDHAEHVTPWQPQQIEEIRAQLGNAGALVVVSSIHVHSFISARSKWQMSARVLSESFALSAEEIQRHCVFIGDSMNDAPMFAHMKHTVGVANSKKYLGQFPVPPKYICKGEASQGFNELARLLLS